MTWVIILKCYLLYVTQTGHYRKSLPHKGIYTFGQQSNSSHQTSASAKTAISSSLGSLIGNTQKERGWPSYDPVNPILLFRDEQHPGKSHCCSLCQLIWRELKNTYWHSSKGYGHYKKPHHEYKTSCGCAGPEAPQVMCHPGTKGRQNLCINHLNPDKSVTTFMTSELEENPLHVLCCQSPAYSRTAQAIPTVLHALQQHSLVRSRHA